MPSWPQFLKKTQVKTQNPIKTKITRWAGFSKKKVFFKTLEMLHIVVHN
jgi:hypothetical protein